MGRELRVTGLPLSIHFYLLMRVYFDQNWASYSCIDEFRGRIGTRGPEAEIYGPATDAARDGRALMQTLEVERLEIKTPPLWSTKHIDEDTMMVVSILRENTHSGDNEDRWRLYSWLESPISAWYRSPVVMLPLSKRGYKHTGMPRGWFASGRTGVCYMATYVRGSWS